MAGGDGEELIQALLESGGILLPGEIVKKHAHRVHADLARHPNSSSMRAGSQVAA